MTTPFFTIARGLGPLPGLLEAARGIPALHRVFRAESVPVEVAQNQNSKLPLRSMMGLIERAAREMGDELFGLNLGCAMQPEDFGPAVKYMLAAHDLRALLWRSRRAIGYQQSGTEFSIDIFHGLVRWGYRVRDGITFGRRQHADHVLVPMLAAIRRYLGRTWTPLRVELECDRPQCWRSLEERFQAPVLFGAHTNALIFDADMLDRTALASIAIKHVVTLNDLRRIVSERPPRTSTEAIQELIRLRLLDSVVDIDGAAKMLGISTRKLQRQLAGENFTYRALVERTRMERAFDLLRESSQSITSIALSLGYTDIASFTRAFGRWTQSSPSDYRGEGSLAERSQT
jgi:AraC-like DNA-binding protein